MKSKHSQLVKITDQPVGQFSQQPRLTVSQVVSYFTASLTKPGNYPRIVKPYILYCLDNEYTVDLFSFGLYTAGKKTNVSSPIRKFLLWYHTHGAPEIVNDPPTARKTIPAADKLILAYIESTSMSNDESKNTYIKSLNAFFEYITLQREAGNLAGYDTRTVKAYIQHLIGKGLSAFTINLRLSAIKQLTKWIIDNRHHPDLDVSTEQLEALRAIIIQKGQRTERKFYKDSLEAVDRDRLLAAIEHPTHKAIVSLLAIEGLRTIEVTRLRVSDIEFDKGRLQVLGKGKASRQDIVLFDNCRQALQAYLASIGKWPVKPTDKEALFKNLKTYQIRYLVDKYLEDVDLKQAHVSAHSLRHTTGQLLIQDGVDPVYVQRHLRHQMFETTLFYIRKQTDQDYFVKVLLNQSNKT